MKTIRQKMNLSCFAMFCGWIACNLVWWVAWLLGPQKQRTGPNALYTILLMPFSTGVVIIAAWFCIFLPVDLLLPETSRFRKPGAAAALGFSVSLILLVLFFVRIHDIQTYGLMGALGKALGGSVLPYSLGTCAAGTVAAWVRAVMDPPGQTPTP